MLCRKCSYEFCWVCGGHYAGHKHDAGAEGFHLMKKLTKQVIPIACSIFIVVKMLHTSNPVFSFKNTQRVFDALVEG